MPDKRDDMETTPTNGELLNLVNAILSEQEQIPRNISNAAIMAAILQMNKRQNEILELLGESKKKYDSAFIEVGKRLDILERNSIIAWINKHPRTFTAIMAFIVLLVMFAHELSPTIIGGIENLIKVAFGI